MRASSSSRGGTRLDRPAHRARRNSDGDDLHHLGALDALGMSRRRQMIGEPVGGEQRQGHGADCDRTYKKLLFAVPCSRFSVRVLSSLQSSAFRVRRSEFGVRSSEFEVRSSERTSGRYPGAQTRAASAARTRTGVNGTCRTRAPVASKIALAMAPATTVTAVSPAPMAGGLAVAAGSVSIT